LSDIADLVPRIRQQMVRSGNFSLERYLRLLPVEVLQWIIRDEYDPCGESTKLIATVKAEIAARGRE